jgi:hypothetical protein
MREFACATVLLLCQQQGSGIPEILVQADSLMALDALVHLLRLTSPILHGSQYRTNTAVAEAWSVSYCLCLQAGIVQWQTGCRSDMEQASPLRLALNQVMTAAIFHSSSNIQQWQCHRMATICGLFPVAGLQDSYCRSELKLLSAHWPGR